MYYDVFSSIPYFVTALFTINIIMSLTIIFIERKNPSAALAWIMILFLLPVAGIFIYTLFSQNIARQKIFKLKETEVREMNLALREQVREMDNGQYEFTNDASEVWIDMIRLNQTYGASFFTQDNKATIMTDGNHMFDSLLTDIAQAKEMINIQYFIIKNDSVGKKLISELTKKAAEGLQVRLLVDALGSIQFSKITPVVQDFVDAGGKIAFFFKPKLKYLTTKLNYRNHRKIAIIDREIGYIGGFNLGREYLGLKKKFGYWRDTHLKLRGSCTHDLSTRFFLDWRAATREDFSLPEILYGQRSPMGNTGVQIVSCGPDEHKAQVKMAYMKMITSARKNIYIQTPYFVPDESILESLKMAAQSGVDVRLMIPCMPDHMFVYWGTYSYAGELLDSGVRIFIYKNGFLHAKTMVVDGEICSVGSANFDKRSFYLNFETNAFMYDEGEAYKLEMIYEEDMADCIELTKQLYRKRGIVIKFKEAIARLVSDLL